MGFHDRVSLWNLTLGVMVFTSFLALLGIVVPTMLVCQGRHSSPDKEPIHPYGMRLLSHVGHFCMALFGLMVISYLLIVMRMMRIL